MDMIYKPDFNLDRFKRIVNSMPDNGEIRIEVERDYGNRTNLSLERVEGFALKGKVLVIACSTNV